MVRKPPENDARDVNLTFQVNNFGTEQLPLYVILEPDEKQIRLVAIYDEALINNVAAFGDFLRDPGKK